VSEKNTPLENFLDNFHPFLTLPYLKDLPSVSIALDIKEELSSRLHKASLGGRFRKALIEGVHMEMVFGIDKYNDPPVGFWFEIELYVSEAKVASTGRIFAPNLDLILWSMKMFFDMDSDEIKSRIMWERIFLEADVISLYWHSK
jgi:hypothetical protein